MTAAPPTDWLVVREPDRPERMVPVRPRLLIGRECAGVEPARRLLIDDPQVSRDHAEVRVDPARGPVLVDLSMNGTRVAGRRVERGELIALEDGDLIEVGATELVFRSLGGPADRAAAADDATRALAPTARLVVVVGDVIGYTALTERHGGRAVAAALDGLWAALRELVAIHGGTLDSVAGDAFFARWDAGHDPDAAARAVGFALAAHDLVLTRTGTPALGGVPVRMGWAVTLGETSSTWPSPGLETMHGDAINLAFRLSGVAARDGRPGVLVEEAVLGAAPDAARYGGPLEIPVKGREAPARVVGAA